MSPPPPIPDWVVQAADWLELALLVLVAVAMLYLWTELLIALAARLWRWLRH